MVAIMKVCKKSELLQDHLEKSKNKFSDEMWTDLPPLQPLLLKYRQLQVISTAPRSGAQNTDTNNPPLTIALNTLIEWL